MSSRFNRIAVVGGGYMGGGIAQTFAMNGIECVLADASAELAQASVDRLLRETDRYASRGLFPDTASGAVRTSLSPAASIEEAVEATQYIVEAVPEDPALKRNVLERIGSKADREAVVASNTSAIPIATLAAGIPEARRFLGVHWMNPAPFVPCVEVIPTDLTDAQIVSDVVDLHRRIGKRPTTVSDSPGFVANRLQYALFAECARMVEEGIAEPAQIDEVVQNSFGFRLPFFGPFAIADIAGLDVYRGGFKTMEAAYGDRIGAPAILDALVSSGRLGTKSLAGFYHYNKEDAHRLAGHRDRAYSALQSLRGDLERPFGTAVD
jgi:3-hydroxybutyryl-CoA dehydrogenase